MLVSGLIRTGVDYRSPPNLNGATCNPWAIVCSKPKEEEGWSYLILLSGRVNQCLKCLAKTPQVFLPEPKTFAGC